MNVDTRAPALKRRRTSSASGVVSLPKALGKEVRARQALERKVRDLLKGHEQKSQNQLTVYSTSQPAVQAPAPPYPIYGGTSGAGFIVSPLCLTDEGDDIQNRTGRKDMPQQLDFSLELFGGSAHVLSRCRVVVVQDTQTNLTPTWTDVFESTYLGSDYERDNGQRFRIIYDSKTQFVQGAANTTAYNQTWFRTTKAISLKKKFLSNDRIKRSIVSREYNDPVAISVPSNCLRGNIWLMAVSDAAAAGTQSVCLNFLPKLYFSDL